MRPALPSHLRGAPADQGSGRKDRENDQARLVIAGYELRLGRSLNSQPDDDAV
jgi:hypothetical protein